MDMSYNSQNSDLNRKAEEFLNEVILNIVLTELSDDLKKQFYGLLEEDKYDEAREFAMQNIPDFQNKLSSKVKELLG
jgi:hypothetical protein